MQLTKSKELYQKAIEIIPGASQTGSKRVSAFAPGAFPMFTVSGKGSHIFDADGREYIDYIMALGPINLGYCYPAVDQAIARQLKSGIIFNLSHPLEIEAAEALIEMIPGADMVRFFKTGAEAVSAAVRVARAYTGREKILSWGYHGWHDMWCAQLPQPLNKGVPQDQRDLIIPFSYNDFTSSQSLKSKLEENKGAVAAIVMTPNNYWEKAKEGYLEYVREMANAYEAILVFDEIVTGFRMANGGAQEYFNVIPDLACYAKGIANGMPISVLTGKREIMQGMEELSISTTYGGETLSLAALTAACEEYRTKPVVAHMWSYGARLMEGLNKQAENYNIKCCFIGYPPLTAFNFTYEEARLNADLMTYFLQDNAENGILYRRGGPIYISYSHNERDLEQTLAVSDKVFFNIAQALEKGDLSARITAIGTPMESIITRYRS